MSKLVLPKATTIAREAATPIEGEIFYDKNKGTVYFGDGATAGGIPLRGAALSNTYVYGIDHDTGVATAASACKRIVLNHDHDTEGAALRYTEVDSFSQMPAHNYKRCVMSDVANRTIAYYLNPSDSTKKENGQAAVLTGADGDVMVEIPVCHFRLDTYTDSNDHVHNVYLVANKPFTGSAPHPYFYTSEGGGTLRVQYVGAFRSVLCNADGTVKAQSDDATPAAYASGNKFRSIAGARPAGSISRANFRNGSRVTGGTNVNTLFGQYMLMMMAIDACTFDTQAGISVGYSQLSAWDYAAVRNTGRTACFGNGTGEVLADETSETGVDLDLLTMKDGGTIWNGSAIRKVVQFSWRGIEDPFGSQWCFEDGIQKYQDDVADDFTKSGYWITNDISKYSLLDTDRGNGAAGSVFPEAGYTGSSYVWVSHPWPKVEGYVKNFDPKTFFPISTGGSSTTYLGDYFFNSAQAGARVVFRGGSLPDGAGVGSGYVSVGYGLAPALALFGSRLAA